MVRPDDHPRASSETVVVSEREQRRRTKELVFDVQGQHQSA